MSTAAAVADPLADYEKARARMRAQLAEFEKTPEHKERSEAARFEPTARLLARANAIKEKLRRLAFIWECDRDECDGLPHEGMWHKHARTSQRMPLGLWLIWAIISGRGFGKTRTGAESVKKLALAKPLHVAVIGETFTKVRDICFEHPTSGLLAVIPPELVAAYTRALGGTVLTLKNGSVFRGLSAEKPDQPRGYAFDVAWYDEYGAWPGNVALDVHDNVMFALRESADPRILITTTPRAVPHVRVVVNDGLKPDSDVVLTRGHMKDNAANLGPLILKRLIDTYEGTRTGRQELAGELLDDVEGALWQGWMFEEQGFRVPARAVPDLARVIVSVDPAASSHEQGQKKRASGRGDDDEDGGRSSDSTGIVVAGKTGIRPVTFGDQRPHGYVLHSEEVRGGPEERCKRAIALYQAWGADCIVVEANKGGDWIPAVIRLMAKDMGLNVPVKLVHASRGKVTRAEPVVPFYEQHRMHHMYPDGPGPEDAPERTQTEDEVGRLAHAKLEDQMLTWVQGDPDSPDLMDALVWALTELMVENMPSVGEQVAADRRLAGRR